MKGKLEEALLCLSYKHLLPLLGSVTVDSDFAPFSILGREKNGEILRGQKKKIEKQSRKVLTGPEMVPDNQDVLLGLSVFLWPSFSC